MPTGITSNAEIQLPKAGEFEGEKRAPKKEPTSQQKYYDRLFNWDKSRERLSKMVKSWDDIIEKAEENRLKRNFELDKSKIEADGDKDEDEVIIEMRVIDDNITKEQPAYVKFLRRSRRLLIFEDKENPTKDNTDLDRQFTRGMTYQGWARPHYKNLDGAQLHAYDQVEKVFDRTKPFMISIEHVGYENLIFDKKSTDLEDNEEILRRYEISVIRLEALSERFGFSKEQVDHILEDYRNKEDSEVKDLIKIYKRFHKYEGKVWVSWFVDMSEDIARNWLRKPKPLLLGDTEQVLIPQETVDPITGAQVVVPVEELQPKQETRYPIHQFRYQEKEEPKIIDLKGRAFQDDARQQAQTALWSTFINGSLRASNVYGSPKTPSTSGSMPYKMDLTLENGCFYSEPMEFFNMPYPTLDLVRAGQFLDSKTQESRGDIASSVINRDDARKTAAELNIAEGKETELDSVKLSNYSDFISDLYSDVWRLVRSMALQGVITLLPITQEDGSVENDVERLQVDYNVKAAGDIDVVEKEEDLQKRVQLWGIVGESPIALQFLGDLLRKAFPEDGERYATMLEQEAQKEQQIAGLVQIVQAMALDDQGNIRPEFAEFAPQLQGLIGK